MTTYELGPNTLLQIRPLNMYAESRPAHRHTFFEIVVLQEAAGVHQIDFIEFPLVSNRIYFIGAGQVHTLRATRLQGWQLMFDPAFLDQGEGGADLPSVQALFNSWQQQPFIDLSPDVYPIFSALLGLLQQECERQQPSLPMLYTYLKAFLLNAKRASVASASSTSAPTVQQACLARLLNLVEQHHSTKHHVAFYAQQLELPPKRLNHYTQQALGKSVTQLLHARLLTESKRLLIYSACKIKEISYTLGFQEPAYFSRFFKNKTGKYPEQFRQEWAKPLLPAAILPSVEVATPK